MTTDPGDLVLDPTCGSGTTAYVAEQWGRRWITIDTSRVAIALARTRLMAGRYPYYVLSDSSEGLIKEAEVSGQLPPQPLPKTANDIKKGFVYKRVPHVTLKAIANNEEIDEIHGRWQGKMDEVMVELISSLTPALTEEDPHPASPKGRGGRPLREWEEWEVPREGGKEWPAGAVELLARWWELRRGRQQEIDASIARRADMEFLYDQPYEENKKVRVTGPFTVESLSPHRVLAADEERPQSEAAGQKELAAGGFEAMILENLKKAGVQNTVKKGAPDLRPAGSVCRGMAARQGRVYRQGRAAAPGGSVHWSRARHGRPGTGQRGGKRSGAGHWVRSADRLWLRVRSACAGGDAALWHLDGAANTDEP
jgi:adenine-specific DNA-methyltransferase